MTFRSRARSERHVVRLGLQLGCALACALVALWPGRIALAEQPLELRWEAPAECPDAKNVRQRIRELAKTSTQTLILRAEGRIEHIDPGYRLVLKIRDGAEVRERTIESASCEDLAGAAAVSLGLLLRAATAEGSTGEDGARSGTPAGTAEGERGPGAGGDAATNASKAGEPSTNAAPNDAAARTSAGNPNAAGDTTAAGESGVREQPADVPKRHWAVLLRAPHAVLSLGPLPKPSLGIGGAVGLRYDEWHALVTGRIYRTQTVWSPLSPDTGAEIDRRALELSVCKQWRAGAFAWAPCAAFDLEQVSARGLGVGIAEKTSSAAVPVVGVLAAAHVYLADWLALTGSLSLAAAGSQPRVVVDGFGPIRQLGMLRGGLALGLEWIF